MPGRWTGGGESCLLSPLCFALLEAGLGADDTPGPACGLKGTQVKEVLSDCLLPWPSCGFSPGLPWKCSTPGGQDQSAPSGENPANAELQRCVPGSETEFISARSWPLCFRSPLEESRAGVGGCDSPPAWQQMPWSAARSQPLHLAHQTLSLPFGLLDASPNRPRARRTGLVELVAVPVA